MGQKEKDLKIQIYFDCICGSIISILALTAIILTAIKIGVKHLRWFIASLTFWSCYLIFAIFLISLGIYTYFADKNFDERKPRKDLKPPILS